MLFTIFITLHLLTCFLLIIVVLMQSSKGGGLSGAFGGAGGQTVFGGRETATFLSKATTYLAILFMITSLCLAFLSANRGDQGYESALRKAAQRQPIGTIVPEEQKDVEDILGNVPPPADESAEQSAGDENPDNK